MGNHRDDVNRPLSTVAGVFLVALGALFLVQQFAGDALPALSWRFLWPVFVIGPGLAFFAGMLQGGKRVGGLAIPGSIFTTTGLLLFYQNLTGHWHSWAYAWALVAPTSVGVGLMIQGWWTGSPKLVREGRRVMAIGLTLFLVGAVFFELVLNISGFASGSVGQFGLPILLIVIGAAIVLRGTRPRRTLGG
jgi:O-antigen/teichoic acid export membrane protein